MAELVGDKKSIQRWKQWSRIGKKSFDAKLWDGKNGYYRLSEKSQDVFADQLWMLWPKITDLPMVVPKDRAISTLKHIFKNNVQNFGNGFMGAVNGTAGYWAAALKRDLRTPEKLTTVFGHL